MEGEGVEGGEVGDIGELGGLGMGTGQSAEIGAASGDTGASVEGNAETLGDVPSGAAAGFGGDYGSGGGAQSAGPEGADDFSGGSSAAPAETSSNSSGFDFGSAVMAAFGINPAYADSGGVTISDVIGVDSGKGGTTHGDNSNPNPGAITYSETVQNGPAPSGPTGVFSGQPGGILNGQSIANAVSGAYGTVSNAASGAYDTMAGIANSALNAISAATFGADQGSTAGVPAETGVGAALNKGDALNAVSSDLASGISPAAGFGVASFAGPDMGSTAGVPAETPGITGTGLTGFNVENTTSYGGGVAAPSAVQIAATPVETVPVSAPAPPSEPPVENVPTSTFTGPAGHNNDAQHGGTTVEQAANDTGDSGYDTEYTGHGPASSAAQNGFEFGSALDIGNSIEAQQLNTAFDAQQVIASTPGNPVTQKVLGPWAAFLPTKDNPFWTFNF